MPALRLPARSENLDPFRRFVRGEAAAAGFSPLDAGRLEMALEELLVNVFHYAYPPEAVGEVELSLLHERGGLKIVLVDAGRPFDLTAAPIPDHLEADIDARPIGGLGIHLVRTIMSELAYRRIDGQNELTLFYAPKEVASSASAQHTD